MMKKIIASLLLVASFYCLAQRATPDQIKTNKGALTVQPILHGTVMFQWNDKTIYVDPYGGGEAFAGLASPNVILITDIHGEHMNPKTLEDIKAENSIIIAPKAVADQLPEKFKAVVTVISNGETIEKEGLTISAIPMYNLPESPDSRHIKGRGNGYTIKFGNKTVYLSGDTSGIPEMRNLKNIDVAFVCMNLPYTMDTDEAASAVLDFKPNVIYPYHYRGQGGLNDVEKFKKLVSDKNKAIEVRLRNWYPEAQK
jgi:L-ascorbate metabolism protein UlaG (beta-lactamase superfamily)